MINVVIALLGVLMRFRSILPQRQLDPAISYLGTDVFTIYDNQRHLVKNWDIFTAFGYHDYDIKRVSKDKLESFPTGLPLLRFKGLNPPVQTQDVGRGVARCPDSHRGGQIHRPLLSQ